MDFRVADLIEIKYVHEAYRDHDGIIKHDLTRIINEVETRAGVYEPRNGANSFPLFIQFMFSICSYRPTLGLLDPLDIWHVYKDFYSFLEFKMEPLYRKQFEMSATREVTPNARNDQENE